MPYKRNQIEEAIARISIAKYEKPPPELRSRIKRLVYLDAFVPENGKCVLDYVVPERAARMREEGERTGSVAPPPLSLWGITKQEHIDFIKPREVRHPYGCFSQQISLREENSLPRTFIYCSSPATGSFDQFAAKYRNDPAWRFHELATGHDAMILMPERVAPDTRRDVG